MRSKTVGSDTMSTITSEKLPTYIELLKNYPDLKHVTQDGAVQYFLTEHRTEGKTWLEHGCIIFSQFI